jgi:hypothetical protein
MLLRGEPGRGGEFAVAWREVGFGDSDGGGGGYLSLNTCTMGVDDGALPLEMKEIDGWGVND